MKYDLYILINISLRKEDDKNLAKELERLENKNTSLKRKAREMEDKFVKLKQIVLKKAKKQESQNRANMSDEMIHFILDYKF